MFHSLFDRKGLTLIELVVVLAILAVLATVAVRSLEPIADQARYETTLQTLEAVANAIVEDRRQSSGARNVSGFVADIGRLPETLDMVIDESGATTFGAGSVSLASYPFGDRNGPAATDANNPTNIDCSMVALRCGWRGPYLNVSNTAAGVIDGWGRPISYAGFPTATDDLHLVWTAVTLQYTDQTVDVESSALQTVSGIILDQFGATKVAKVALVYPDPTVSTSNLAVLADADGEADGRFRFENVPVGVRAMVFQSGGTTAIRYIEVTPLQQANLPITITEF
jgi:prepilin-type N-terminal cleavage/methylation domain-containing protein